METQLNTKIDRSLALLLRGKKSSDEFEEKLNIIFFATRPDKEYANEGGWDNTWDNSIGYSDWGYVNTHYKDWSSKVQDINNKRLLKDVLVIRKDGFLFNAVNGGVFYADETAIKYLERLFNNTLEDIKKNNPVLSKKLLL
jgi:flagellar biosynthesis regulator FlaF